MDSYQWLIDMGLVNWSEADRKQLSRMTDFIDEQLSAKNSLVMWQLFSKYTFQTHYAK